MCMYAGYNTWVTGLCRPHPPIAHHCIRFIKYFPTVVLNFLVHVVCVPTACILNIIDCFSAYLIQPYRELQLLAADSDRLIATLVEYLQDRPDENDDLIQEKHLNQFDRLRESVFLALAGLGSNREEIRLKIVSERNMLKSLSEGLSGDNVNIKITAMRSVKGIVATGKDEGVV